HSHGVVACMSITPRTQGLQAGVRMKTWFVLLAVLAAMPAFETGARAQAPRYDLLLKSGHVIDPANGLDQVMDVAVANGKLAAVAHDIGSDNAGKTVDVSGLYVTPGLIDIHFHVGHGGAPLNWFAPEARSRIPSLGIPPDLALQAGVTTLVDAGTAG